MLEALHHNKRIFSSGRKREKRGDSAIFMHFYDTSFGEMF